MQIFLDSLVHGRPRRPFQLDSSAWSRSFPQRGLSTVTRAAPSSKFRNLHLLVSRGLQLPMGSSRWAAKIRLQSSGNITTTGWGLRSEWGRRVSSGWGRNWEERFGGLKVENSPGGPNSQDPHPQRVATNSGQLQALGAPRRLSPQSCQTWLNLVHKWVACAGCHSQYTFLQKSDHKVESLGPGSPCRNAAKICPWVFISNGCFIRWPTQR